MAVFLAPTVLPSFRLLAGRILASCLLPDSLLAVFLTPTSFETPCWLYSWLLPSVRLLAGRIPGLPSSSPLLLHLHAQKQLRKKWSVRKRLVSIKLRRCAVILFTKSSNNSLTMHYHGGKYKLLHGTVKAGNVVTFGAQNNFFLRILFR